MNEYVYHGTSRFYLPFIIRDGLGSLPDEIYNKVKFINDNSYFEEKLLFNSPLDYFTKNNINGKWHKILEIGKRAREENIFEIWFAYLSSIGITKIYGTLDDGKYGLGEAMNIFIGGIQRWNIFYSKSTSPSFKFIFKEVFECANELINMVVTSERRLVILAIKKSSIRESDLLHNLKDTLAIKRKILPSEIFVYEPENQALGTEHRIIPLVE